MTVRSDEDGPPEGATPPAATIDPSAVRETERPTARAIDRPGRAQTAPRVAMATHVPSAATKTDPSGVREIAPSDRTEIVLCAVTEIVPFVVMGMPVRSVVTVSVPSVATVTAPSVVMVIVPFVVTGMPVRSVPTVTVRSAVTEIALFVVMVTVPSVVTVIVRSAAMVTAPSAGTAIRVVSEATAARRGTVGPVRGRRDGSTVTTPGRRARRRIGVNAVRNCPRTSPPSTCPAPRATSSRR